LRVKVNLTVRIDEAEICHCSLESKRIACVISGSAMMRAHNA
jgi:hypothetical protein